MKKLHYLLFAMIMGLAVSFTSCSSDDDSPVGPVNPTPETPTANKTIKEIKALAVDGEFTKIAEDFIIEGVVISSDEAGNFYKALWLQDTKDGGEGGIYLKVNKDDLYQEFAIGQKIVVKCKDLELDVYGGQPSLGVSYEKNGEQKLGGIDEAKIASTIFKVGEATAPTANIVSIDALTDAMVGTLIKIENLQVKESDLAKTYAIDEKSTNITLTNEAGEEIIVRTSGYADFKGETVAQGSGSVTAILSKFNETYQLSLRNVADIDMTGTRFEVAGGDTGEDDGDNGVSFFPGSDFETWETFTGALNQYGLKDYVTQSDNGRNDSKALYINTTPTKNDYVFTAVVPEGFDATGKTKIIFYIKGTSGKSLSLNVYNAEGSFAPFNLGDCSAAAIVESSGSNGYTGTINTGDNWLKVTLNISEVALQTTVGQSLFALKVGKEQAYDLLVDDITIK